MQADRRRRRLRQTSARLVMQMQAQGLTEADAIAALEACDGDGDNVSPVKSVPNVVGSHYAHRRNPAENLTQT